MTEKEKKVLDLPKVLLYVFESVVIILLFFYVYFSMQGNKEYEGVYSEHYQKQLIEVLFTSLKLQNIHSIPYIGMNPIIQMYITQNDYFVSSYYLEVIDGKIIIYDGVIAEKDVIISTTEEEIQRITEDDKYIIESLISGRTSIQKTTSNFILFSKGYPELFIR